MTTMPRPSAARTAGIGWLGLSALAVAVLAPLPYVLNPLRDLADAGGEIAGHYVDRPAWSRGFFFLHVAGGGLALLLSPLQLSARVRARAPRVHRVVGRVVLAAIAAAGVAGLVLAPSSLAGPVGTGGFGLLALLWLTFAALGLRAVRSGDVGGHRRWMLRTFAMTYAAVTLRLWLIALIPLVGDFPRAYAIVPFLCWVPNLVVVELLLRRPADPWPRGTRQRYRPGMPTDQDRSWVDSMPEVYDRRLGPAVFRPFAVEVAARAARLPAGPVLELAAGTGVLTRELVATRPDVVATDLNPAMVAWGARAVPRARWLAADAQRPPFRDGAFDLVTCQFGVMFLPDRPAAFAAARRLLAPEGRLLFTTWDTIDRHGFEHPFMAAVRRVLPDDPPLFLERVPHGYHDVGRIAADVRAAGFAAVEVETVTCAGHAPSAADLAVGYCAGSPVRAGLFGRGELPALTAAIADAFTDLVGPGPLTRTMSAHVVTARD